MIYLVDLTIKRLLTIQIKGALNGTDYNCRYFLQLNVFLYYNHVSDHGNGFPRPI